MPTPHAGSPIGVLISIMLCQLVGEFGSTVSKNVASFAAMTGGTIPIGTLCSGSGLISPIASVSFARLGKLVQMPLKAKTMFTCDVDPRKRAWIESNVSPTHSFGDICTMGEEQSRCHRMQAWVNIPWALLVWAGFQLQGPVVAQRVPRVEPF